MIKTKFKPPTTNHEPRTNPGSALILAVVLTSLLAIIGVMFVLVSRLDKMATSGLSENKELNSAVETVIAKISQELALDVPGVAGQEYYDYPDANNIWLACLEPYWFGTGDYKWRRISDIYDVLDANNLQAEIIDDYQTYIIDANADADGDGVSDSVWVAIPDMNSSKGKPIYAAIRIVDNGGMLNVNTAYKFDPTDTEPNIDGHSQMQINLAALSVRGANGSLATAADKLQEWRCGTEPNDLLLYEQNVIWQYLDSIGAYTPFDTGDELELRFRHLINQTDIDTRIEVVWDNVFQVGKQVPFDSNLPGWFERAQYELSEPNNYSYRHLATTYNMDRIIDPNGTKMASVNDSNEYLLYAAIREGLIDGGFVDPNSLAAQIAVNIKDYVDTDEPNVTVLNGHYGFEWPCIYISELAHRFVRDTDDPSIIYESYAVELYMSYAEDNHPVGWQLAVDENDYSLDSWVAGQYYVILKENTMAPLNAVGTVQVEPTLKFKGGTSIELQRPIPSGGYITVDSFPVPPVQAGWLLVDNNPHSLQRDINRHKCIRRLWSGPTPGATLGFENGYNAGGEQIQAHPANSDFTNIGEIGMVFCRDANSIGPSDTEDNVRLDLQNSALQQLFNYLTVFDPTVDGIDNNGDGYGISDVDPNELKVPGRLNINTAPWFVLAQLPWVTDPNLAVDDPNRYGLAWSIVGHRETIEGFRSIGELMNVLGMDYYQAQTGDLLGFPDLTGDDGAPNDFEERDVIFARISNLVTVRSDVFTAYILVRIGNDGPQKRVMAILDRSNVYYDPVEMREVGKVKIRALHLVPDPR